MSTKAPVPPPRQLLNEYLLEVSLSRSKHIVVEGITDVHFFQTWASSADLTGKVTVIEVSGIEIENSTVEELGFTVGNRGRVVRVAAAANAAEVDIRCVADRDTGHGTSEHTYATLLWTDFPALESYALTEDVLNVANQTGFARKLPSAEEIIVPLAHALRELFAVRLVHPNLESPNHSAGIPKAGNLATFDVARCVDVRMRSRVSTYTRPDDEDPRHYAYGHDIAPLLLAGFSNQLKNQAGISKVEAVEGVLRLAVLAVGEYSTADLFVQLHRWCST